MKQNNEFTNTFYGIIANIYDFLDIFHYGNVCRRSRNALLNILPLSPKNPLIIGCGTGDFAATFVKRFNPPRLSICDISQKMLNNTVGRINRLNWSGTLEVLHTDAMKLSAQHIYDFISINYVLNLFNPIARIHFVKKVITLLEKEGLIYIADFTRPQNKFILSWAQLSWYLLCVFFFLTTASKIVKMGDLKKELLEINLELLYERSFVGGMYGTFLLKLPDNTNYKN